MPISFQEFGEAVDEAAIAAVEASRSPAERADLPAFLSGYELPEGYKWLDFPNGSKQRVALGKSEGSSIVCYIQGFGVELVRGPRGTARLRLSAVPFPKEIEIVDWNFSTNKKTSSTAEFSEEWLPVGGRVEGVGLEVDNIGSPRLKKRIDRFSTGRVFTNYIVVFPKGLVIRKKEANLKVPDFGLFGIHFYIDDTGEHRNILIENQNMNGGGIDRIALPSEAIVGRREETAARGEEIARAAREEQRKIREEEQKREMAFMAGLEDLADLENQAAIDADELKRQFENAKLEFARLPADRRWRSEVMKGVMGQLGERGERLRKAGKKDEEIFEEWLKLVFMPLYRRAGKR